MRPAPTDIPNMHPAAELAAGDRFWWHGRLVLADRSRYIANPDDEVAS